MGGGTRSVPHPSRPCHDDAPPLWELFQDPTGEQLVGLIAGEAWERSRAPYQEQQIALAELAHVESGGSWASYLAIETAYRDAATEQADAAAWLGFCLAVVAMTAPDDTPTEDLCRLAMAVAKVLPMSRAGRLICTARLLDAMDRRIQLQSSHQKGKGTR